jgi:hypothetical protein
MAAATAPGTCDACNLSGPLSCERLRTIPSADREQRWRGGRSVPEPALPFGCSAVAGYGTDVDRDLIRARWSLRSLRGVRWLIQHGFDPWQPGCEVDVLTSRL